MKTCTVCRRTLPLGAFNVNRVMAAGLDVMCRTCRSDWKTGKPGGKKAVAPLELTPTTIGYVAGMIDGEGSVIIKPVTERQLVSLCYVTNTHRPMLDWLKAELGMGNVVVSQRPQGHRICYRWVLTGKNVRRLLLAVRGAMIVKRRHADILLEFYERRATYKETFPGALKPETLREPLLGLYTELRTLNRKGPPVA